LPFHEEIIAAESQNDCSGEAEHRFANAIRFGAPSFNRIVVFDRNQT
jgi:hypothetical protein